MQRLVAGAPVLLETLDAESKAHFEALCAHLRSAGIEYDVEPRLVRGLDYYTRTVFEWTTDALGSQSTVCAGGRYDGLVAPVGRARHARHRLGDGAGAHRHAAREAGAGRRRGIGRRSIWCWSGSGPRLQGFRLAEQLREAWPDLRLQVNLGGGNFKTQFKRADKSGAQFALILGDDEVARGVVALKALRQELAQEECPARPNQ